MGFDINNIDEIVAKIMEENNIPDIQMQKYYSLKWFLSALKNDRYTFQKPSSWSDPFEDFISNLSNDNGLFVSGFNITNDIFAMSTINKRSECDGMWSNFAKTNGVLIYTSSRKIVESLVSFLLTNGCCKNKKIFTNDYDVYATLKSNIKIEKINYMSDKSIADFFKRLSNHSQDDYDSIRFKALSIKRMEYDYESEYRVFIVPNQLNLKEEKFLKVGFFKQTISKIVLSPQASYLREKRLKYVLEKKYSIRGNIIEKSKLYDISDFKSKYGLK